MNAQGHSQLRYYIALSAPSTRAPARGDERFMRPEVGFTPSWFQKHCGIDFSQRWHEDPDYRWESHTRMRDEIHRRFPGRAIGATGHNAPPDLLTGVFGSAVVPAMFGRHIKYAPDMWPSPYGTPLSDQQVDSLQPLDVENNVFFSNILSQLDRIEQLTGSVYGFLNWQGVLNTAFRLRGDQIFMDLYDSPQRAYHLFDCVAETMVRGIKRLYERQEQSGLEYRFATISNCVVNMLRSEHYAEHVLPFDLRIRAEFEGFGIHNCAWAVDPYMDAYATVPELGYIDMGLKSNLVKAKQLFPTARRTVLFTSMDLANKTEAEIRRDFERVARDLAPCDVGLPDIEADVSDDRVQLAMRLCDEYASAYEGACSPCDA